MVSGGGGVDTQPHGQINACSVDVPIRPLSTKHPVERSGYQIAVGEWWLLLEIAQPIPTAKQGMGSAGAGLACDPPTRSHYLRLVIILRSERQHDRRAAEGIRSHHRVGDGEPPGCDGLHASCQRLNDLPVGVGPDKQVAGGQHVVHGVVEVPGEE